MQRSQFPTTLLISILVFVNSSLALTPLREDAEKETLPPVVPIHRYVNLTRYSGLWYEQARIPIPYTTGCDCSTALYEFKPERKVVEVTNTCNYINGTSVPGYFVGESRNRNNTELFVKQKTPPYIGGDYWILDLGETQDYGYALIGDPERSTLWILSRVEVLGEDRIEQLLKRARDLGYDTSRVKRDPVKKCFQEDLGGAKNVLV